MKNDAFAGFHPVINFFYFVFVIVCSMLFMHPVFLGISLISAALYAVYLNRRRAVKFLLAVILPMMVLLAILNPVFNHAGATILVYVNDNPVTLEAILYGGAAAVMMGAVLIWFSCYNAVMTSDKFIYLFGRVIPALSLIFSMVLRFVPKFKAQIKVISNAQKCVGRDVSNGKFWKRIRNGVRILSILVTWALENAIETADSMRSRGYGLRGRTSYSNYRFDRRDGFSLGLLGGLAAVVLFGAFAGWNDIVYFPAVYALPMTAASFVVYIAYAAFCLFPLAADLYEDAAWARRRCGVPVRSGETAEG